MSSVNRDDYYVILVVFWSSLTIDDFILSKLVTLCKMANEISHNLHGSLGLTIEGITQRYAVA